MTTKKKVIIGVVGLMIVVCVSNCSKERKAKQRRVDYYNRLSSEQSAAQAYRAGQEEAMEDAVGEVLQYLDAASRQQQQQQQQQRYQPQQPVQQQLPPLYECQNCGQKYTGAFHSCRIGGGSVRIR